MQEVKVLELRFLLWPDVPMATLIGLLDQMGANVGSVNWSLVRLRGGLRIYIDDSPEMDKIIDGAKRRI